MAAPHVAGLAALMRQAHPTWTPEQVKAALMNTAVDLAISASRPVPRQGAGRIRAYPSVTAETLAIGDPDRVSLNWGVLPIEANTYTTLKNITLQNFGLTTKVYSATWSFGFGSRTLGVSLSLPPTVTVPAVGTAAVPVTLNINATQLSSLMRTLEEYYGYVVFTNTALPTETLRVPFYLSPRPYTRLTELGSSTTFDYETEFAWFDLYHSGPISSSLWVYPVFAVDGNETGVADAGDVRLVGVDYGWRHATYGDIFVVAINTWGSWHTPQPYFAEFDLYLDEDEDGNPDLVDFNWNYGRATGAANNDQWVVVQVNLSTGVLDLASPYLIYTDYNAGFMEWYLPATWNGLTNIGGANTNFDFQLIGFDYWGTSDVIEAGRFDIARPPFWWGWDTGYPRHPGPFGRETVYAVGVNDPDGYLYSRPKGVMIVDYNGKPGKGQAYYWPLKVTGFSFGVELAPPAAAQSDYPGEEVTYTLTVTNTGNYTDTFNVAVSGNAWTTNAPATVGPVAPGASATFQVVVTIPTGVTGADTDTATVTVTSRNDSSKTAQATLTTRRVLYRLFLPLVTRNHGP